MPEVAQATITVTPVLEGAQQSLTEQMTSAAGPAGTEAGNAAGSNMATALSDKMGAAGSTLTKTVTGPLAAIGTAAVASWKEVDTGLDTIVQKTGASGEALDSMHEVLNNIATSIPTDFETAGSAIGEVNTRFGLVGDELEELSGQFIKFAKLNDQDVSNSVDSVSKMMAAFGMDTKDASKMLDALNTVGQQTGVDVMSLSDTIAANAKSFQEMGMTADEAASFLGSMSMAGLDSSTAMKGIQTAMKKASSEGKTLDDVLGEFEETMNSNASESDKLAAAYELFGTRAGGAIENAVSNGTISLTDFSSSLGDFEGSVSDTFEGTLDPMDDFQTTLNELKVLGADIVTTAGPELKDIMQGIADAVKGVTEAWSELDPDMQDFIIKAAGIAAAVGPILLIGSKIIGGISSIAGGLGSLLGGMGGVTEAASEATGPVAAAGGSFGTFAGQALKMIAAAAALYIAAQAVSVLVDSAIRISEAGWPAIAVLAGMAVGIAALMGVAAALAPALTAGAVGIVAFGASFFIMSAGIALASAGIALLVAAVTNLVSVISANAPSINSIVSNIGTTVSDVITSISDGLSGIIDSISGGISDVLDSIAGVIDSIGTSALNAGTGFEKLAGAVTNLVNGTGVLDLGATLAAVATGVDSINSSASGAGDSADKVGQLGTSLGQLATSAGTATKALTTFGTSGQTAMSQVANSIRSANLSSSMGYAINGAMNTARAGINSIVGMFASTSFRFNQYIPMPHFSLTGEFDAKTKKVPTASVVWYAQAAERGALFTDPTIIGVGDASQPELLIGTDKLKELVGSGMTVTNYITVSGAENPEDWARRFTRQMALEARMA